jgi:hypothetical protein
MRAAKRGVIRGRVFGFGGLIYRQRGVGAGEVLSVDLSSMKACIQGVQNAMRWRVYMVLWLPTPRSPRY